ncbi:hypothetical protein [Brevundimonas sp.]
MNAVVDFYNAISLRYVLLIAGLMRLSPSLPASSLPLQRAD